MEPQVYFSYRPMPDMAFCRLTELQRQIVKTELCRSMQQAKNTMRLMGDPSKLPREQREYYVHIAGHVWLMEGLLFHSIDPVSLQAVADRYESLGLVPVGYLQPELFTRRQKTMN